MKTTSDSAEACEKPVAPQEPYALPIVPFCHAPHRRRAPARESNAPFSAEPELKDLLST
jgi:hypothetical protein